MLKIVYSQAYRQVYQTSKINKQALTLKKNSMAAQKYGKLWLGSKVLILEDE